MEKKRKQLKIIISLLFICYLVLLVWIILFKLQFNISDIDQIRRVNLIPFYYSTASGNRFHISEVMDNVIIFIPFGVLLSMLYDKMNAGKKFILIFCTSLFLEIMQFILSIGSTDITDLITNSLGGIMGIVLYGLLVKVIKDKQKLDWVISVIAGIAAVLFLGMISVLLLAN
jgi:glycopeptide antibiotics resistance protein